MSSKVSDHGVCTHSADPIRSLAGKNGRFAYLFPGLSPWTSGTSDGDELLARGLSIAMHTDASGNVRGSIPAGFTYLGQFIDHDITFDPTSIGEKIIDQDQLENFRTPALDLDCIYGGGPSIQPYLYQRKKLNNDSRFLTGIEFLVGPVKDPQGGPGQDVQAVKDLDGAFYDLPRASFGIGNNTAIIGDKRNDENIIVSQLHRTFLHFHNAVCMNMSGASFEKVRLEVIRHYQWIVVNEFLPLIVGAVKVSDALNELKFYRIGDGGIALDTFIPVEFSGAAYRFGHSMVRSTYHFNQVFPAGTPFSFAFDFTADGEFLKVPGLNQYPTNWLMDWSRFFDGIGGAAQKAMKIDCSLVPELKIRGSNAIDDTFLAELNLKRSFRSLRLPSGQAIADRIGVTKLTSADLTSGIAGNFVQENEILQSNTPLWFYILKEAEINPAGHLGEVGGTIVAEVFIGLLKADPESILNAPGWTPQFGNNPGEFSIAELFNFIEKSKGLGGSIPANGVVNPLG